MDMEVEGLKGGGWEKMLCEKMRGGEEKRGEVDGWVRFVGEGERVVVYKVEGVGGWVKNMVRVLEDLKNRGMELR